jgi:tripartite-type tricarboxylate transporter receptor subunit TctC
MKILRWQKETVGKGIVLFGLLFLVTVSLSFAQEFPTKPVNVIVGAGPGGAIDTSTRVLGRKSEKILGQPVILTNNSGGAGVVALTLLKSQKPDGYNLVGLSNTSLVVTPHLRNVAYTPDDFTPIVQYAENHSGLYVRGDSPWKTFKEFITFAKQNPDKVNYTTTTVGSGMHVAMEFMSAQEGGIKWTLVPYTTGDPIIPLLGNHVNACSSSIAPTGLPHLKSGSLRLLAVYGERRLKLFPDVPTLLELGYDYTWESKSLLMAPKGVSPALVKRLEDAFRQATADPEYIKTLEQMVIEPTYVGSDNTKKYFADAYPRFGKLIDRLKIPKESEGK